MSMEPQVIELNGKKYKVTYEEIKESESISEFHREKGQYYWVMNCFDGEPFKYCDTFSKGDNVAFESGNYFSTKEDTEYVAKREILFRKMLRFSLMNGLRDLTKYDDRYLLVIDNGEVHCVVEPFYIRKKDCVYFASDKAARQARKLFRKEFKELYGNH